jgi:endonuclease-8
MPEGDTIYRAARTMHAALAGRVVTRFESVLPKLLRVDVAGRTIDGVRAEGKNLFIDFSGELHLHTHMRMHGMWHLYRPGERWRKRRSDMRIVIETDAWIAVGFNIPVADFNAAIEIGPDLLADAFDLDEALRRMREHGADEIADVLLDQRVAAGIGNEYKSEVLFLGCVSPFTPTARLTDDQLAALLRIARKSLRASVLSRSRPNYVYGRAGRPCRKCGTPISMVRQGRDARLTFWCPRCQPL